jgi:hypothetical protein
MMEALISETSVTRATRPNIPEDVTLQNWKYIAFLQRDM